jgi:hypothetical protein
MAENMDLPNELRRIADIELTGYSEKMMRQAADEIERLQSLRIRGRTSTSDTF